MTVRRLTALSTVLLLSVAPATGRHKPAVPTPKHNFVLLDLSWPEPEQRPSKGTAIEESFLDAASAVRQGDAVEFDVLDVFSNLTEDDAGGPVQDFDYIHAYTKHYIASCGWRTVRQVRRPASAAGEDSAKFHDVIVEDGTQYYPVIDRLCAGLPLNAVQGADSSRKVVADWKEIFEPPGPLFITPVQQAPPPPQAAWMSGRNPSRFVVIDSDAATGNLQFLDMANLERDGDSVTGLALEILGPQQVQSSGRGGVVALRRARYDCVGRSLSILAEAIWTKNGAFKTQQEMPLPPHAAGASPVAAMQIAAACGTNAAAPPPQSFASVQEAWAYARTQWFAK